MKVSRSDNLEMIVDEFCRENEIAELNIRHKILSDLEGKLSKCSTEEASKVIIMGNPHFNNEGIDKNSKKSLQ